MGVKARVLLADDEEVFGATTAELLRRAGFHCDRVSGADEALVAVQAGNHEVLVADIMMPGNAGLDLLVQLQALEWAPAVILVTGYPSVETAISSLEKGVFAYKVKPFDIDDFIRCVGDAAQRVRLQRGLRHEQERSQALSQRMQEFGKLLHAVPRSGQINITAQQYMGTVLASVLESMMDVLRVLELMDAPSAEVPLRKLARHPDALVYREAIRETVSVLESTKSSFKSRELADLRRKLDVLLQVVADD